MTSKPLTFAGKDDTAESLLELRRLVLRGDARITATGIDSTGKLTLRVALPGSETVRKPVTKR